MSLVQIPNLPAAIALNGQEQLEAVQAGASVRVTSAQISQLAQPYLGSPLQPSMGGTGTGTVFTTGSIVFAGASGIYNQDNSKLFWDNTNFRLGVGNNTPSYSLDITGTFRATGNSLIGGTLGVTGALTLGNPTTAQGVINLSGATSGTVTVQGAAAAGTWSFTLPTTAGTNGYILTTDGTGVSAWTNPTALGIDVNIGTTAIVGGSSGRVLYDNAGVFGEYSVVPLSVGGTNANLTASNGGIFYSTASAGAILSGTATANQLLLSGSSSAPSWSTATYPPTTTINQLLYSSAANTVTGLATANGGVLNTSSTGVPSITITPTLGVQQTSQGKLIFANTAVGAFSTTVQASNSATAAWALTLPPASPAANGAILTSLTTGVSSWTSILPVANGGTNASAAGIASFNNITGYSAIGATGTTSTNLVFSTAPTLTGVGLAAGTNSLAPLTFTSGTNLTAPASGAVEYDGTVFTATAGANFKRGTIPLTNYASGTGTALGTNTEATLANFLPAGNTTITLPIGTYFLDITYVVTRGASTTTATTRLNILGSGAAVGTFSGAAVSSIAAAGATNNFFFDAVNINTSNVVSATNATSAGVYYVTFRGILKITTSGTIVPQYNLSANINGAGTVSKVYHFIIQELDSQSAAAAGPAGTGWA